MHSAKVADIRQELARTFAEGASIEGRGGRVVEIIGASFIADERSIFGPVNEDYVKRELEWYESQSRSIHTFPGGAPSIWLACADNDGYINSNYGWCMDSAANGWQRAHVIAELKQNPSSRRAIAIYTRPSMHTDAARNGMQDFMCTNAVEYFLRNGLLHCVVQMRSSDAVLGYRNDRAWHRHMLEQIAAELKVDTGLIHWQAGNLHVYERHFHYLEAL